MVCIKVGVCGGKIFGEPGCACVHQRMSVCVCVGSWVCGCGCVRICAVVCVCACARAHAYMSTHVQPIHVCSCGCVRCAYKHACAHKCVGISMGVYARRCECVDGGV